MIEKFLKSADDIKPLVTGLGGCIATNFITQGGLPVRFMYREAPDNDIDSGWRFMTGAENDEYMNDPNNHKVYDVNTIANYDPTIISFLNAPFGSAFEKVPGALDFVLVDDWRPTE